MLSMHGVRITTDLTASGARLLTAGKHTRLDWGLVPTARPVVQPPPDLTPTVKIPGAIETPELRLTGLTGGHPVYGMRTGEWEFKAAAREKWPLLYSEILNYLHGRQVLAVLDDQKSYYYTGTLTVGTMQSSRAFVTLSLRYSFRPYKYDICTTLEDWLWDPFCFIDGVIRRYRSLPVAGTASYTVIGSALPVVPVFTAAGTVSVSWNGQTFALESGVPTRIGAIVLDAGAHMIAFSGQGTVHIEYRGGKL